MAAHAGGAEVIRGVSARELWQLYIYIHSRCLSSRLSFAA